MLTRLSLAVSLVATLPAVGSADFVTFTDRAAWQAVAGTPTATEDFQGFTQDAFIFPTPVQANGFSIAADGSLPSFFAGRVDVLPFSPVGAARSLNGTNFFWGSLVNDLDLSPPQRDIILTFTGETRAFGADMRMSDSVLIDVYGAGNTLLGTISPTGTPTTHFYGFVLTGGEGAERLVVRVGDPPGPQDGSIFVPGFAMDNAATVPTPEPASFALFGGLLAAGARAVRRQTAKG